VETLPHKREVAKGRPLTNDERAGIALMTRRAKAEDGTPAEAVAVWRAHGRDFGFGGTDVDALRRGPGFRLSLDEPAALVRTASLERIRARGLAVSTGDARATVFESAAERLRLTEAMRLLDDMERAGELKVQPSTPRWPKGDDRKGRASAGTQSTACCSVDHERNSPR
ncbi:MAG: hypothetical protein ACRDNK_17760, partial [Solirubrobacteraceae bacterium]